MLSASNKTDLPPSAEVRPTCHCVFSGSVLSFVSMVTGVGSSGVVVALPVLEADHLSGWGGGAGCNSNHHTNLLTEHLETHWPDLQFVAFSLFLFRYCSVCHLYVGVTNFDFLVICSIFNFFLFCPIFSLPFLLSLFIISCLYEAGHAEMCIIIHH